MTDPLKMSPEVPTTDEGALEWLADKPDAAKGLYRLYRIQKFSVKDALYDTLLACLPAEMSAEIERKCKR